MYWRVLSRVFLAFSWSAGFGTFLQAPALDSYWLEDFSNVKSNFFMVMEGFGYLQNNDGSGSTTLLQILVFG
jgi:hypothetical protein